MLHEGGNKKPNFKKHIKTLRAELHVEDKVHFVPIHFTPNIPVLRPAGQLSLFKLLPAICQIFPEKRVLREICGLL